MMSSIVSFFRKYFLMTYIFLCSLCPPISEFPDFLREISTEWSESICSFGMTFFDDSDIYEFYESIGENLGIGIPDISPDIREVMVPICDRIQDEYVPLLSKKCV